MLLSRLLRLFGFVYPVLLPVAVAYGAISLVPLPWSAAASLAVMALLALGGCFVLGTTSVQRITWRHHVARMARPRRATAGSVATAVRPCGCSERAAATMRTPTRGSV